MKGPIPLARCWKQTVHPKPDSSGHEVQRSKADGRAAFAKNHCSFVSKKIEYVYFSVVNARGDVLDILN